MGRRALLVVAVATELDSSEIEKYRSGVVQELATPAAHQDTWRAADDMKSSSQMIESSANGGRPNRHNNMPDDDSSSCCIGKANNCRAMDSIRSYTRS